MSDNDHGNPEQKPNQDDDRRTKILATLDAAKIPPENNKIIPDASNDDRHNKGSQISSRRKEFSTTDIVIAIATVVIAVVGIFQLLTFLGQLGEMREGGKDTRRLAEAAKAQADAARATADATDNIAKRALRQIEATNRLAGAAENSARIADNALQKSQESAALERRPWLGFNFTDNSVESGGYLRVNLIGIMTNTGKTPAVGIEKRVFFVRRNNSNTKGLDIDNLHKAYYAQDGMEFPAHESWTIDDIMDTRERYNPIQRIDDVWPVIAVAPPNSIVHFPVMRDVNIKIDRPDKIGPYDRKGVFIHIVGEFSYYDTPRTKKYKTGFCIERDFEEDFPRFRPCSFGGWYMEDDKQSETRK